ncbi:MAG: purine biosynthesis protein PurH [Lachnospiraceae bacterium]|nr:purine biosynthesis protein PurH [Lachnospiraceae bacterium]
MKSTLIKDTTKEERIALIREWIPVEDGLEDCEIDLFEMYRDYIDGKKEIAQINEEFRADYVEEDELK